MELLAPDCRACVTGMAGTLCSAFVTDRGALSRSGTGLQSHSLTLQLPGMASLRDASSLPAAQQAAEWAWQHERTVADCLAVPQLAKAKAPGARNTIARASHNAIFEVMRRFVHMAGICSPTYRSQKVRNTMFSLQLQYIKREFPRKSSRHSSVGRITSEFHFLLPRFSVRPATWLRGCNEKCRALPAKE